jgi:hypothetical protein
MLGASPSRAKKNAISARYARATHQLANKVNAMGWQGVNFDGSGRDGNRENANQGSGQSKAGGPQTCWLPAAKQATSPGQGEPLGSQSSVQ